MLHVNLFKKICNAHFPLAFLPTQNFLSMPKNIFYELRLPLETIRFSGFGFLSFSPFFLTIVHSFDFFAGHVLD